MLTQRRGAADDFRKMIVGLIHKFVGNNATAPELPSFFLDSINWKTHAQTQQQRDKFRQLVISKNPLSKNQVVVPNVNFLLVMKEEQNRILVDTRYENVPEGRKRIMSYEDQEREQRTPFTGNAITYSDWTSTCTWDETAISKIEDENRTICVRTDRNGV